MSNSECVASTRVRDAVRKSEKGTDRKKKKVIEIKMKSKTSCMVAEHEG